MTRWAGESGTVRQVCLPLLGCSASSIGSKDLGLPWGEKGLFIGLIWAYIVFMRTSFYGSCLLALALASISCGGSDSGPIALGAGAGGSGGIGGINGGGGAGGTMDPPPPPLCKPSGGGPYWILETETVSFQVECTTKIGLAPGDLSVGPLPDGASYDEGARVFSFTPNLSQAAVYQIPISVASTKEQVFVKIGVADKFNDPANVPVVNPLAYSEEYGLPVLFLDPAPQSETYAPAAVTYRGHTYNASSKLRGAASLNYPKKSYTIEFDKADKFKDPYEQGFHTERRKIVLISTFDDNSYVRQRLSYDLWNRLDPAHIQIRTYSAVVYINGQYWGLYTVSDHVDGFMLEDMGYNQDGNLYKAVNHDANFSLYSTQNGGAPKTTLHQGYVKREGFPLEGQPGAFDDLEQLVNFVATSDSATFLGELDQRIDRRDFEDWWIFVTFIIGSDSAGKNSYLYHDPISDKPWRYAPWDFNHSFGQTWQTARTGASVKVEYTGANKLFDRFLQEPTIGNPLRARYDQVLHGQYDKDKVLALVDEYIARIDTSALRDESKWQKIYRNYGGWNWRNDFTTYKEEVVYLKAWIAERWGYQDNLY